MAAAASSSPSGETTAVPTAIALPGAVEREKCELSVPALSFIQGGGRVQHGIELGVWYSRGRGVDAKSDDDLLE